ncbi:FeoC-like transcriptional regulator [Cereibacter sphaeroides]|uniref:FeoC-like transcriptional regulator n=1 Tax=Cereibacter sphaeroides TaxID=1063 RepID=UPI000191C6AB|nr:FeoC-like transcriptional regulator [Cereibacter sphaeroides]EKX57751.1 hypothetical protein D516_1213 [Rhodobacter sp. AKP1]ACL99981.1 Hypothetical Protein RSKD131_0122 [Cereibacter sphaeroides KD131]AZB56363.1 hypothetical protein EBL89_14005 [Cereibacter sphaeroides]AZB60621.1 hypothetical protein EBL88_13880 [Cereibacter sphaeroides]RHZ97830.1 hypothetical protein D1122_11325 [Cereibacter sphaeroides]
MLLIAVRDYLRERHQASLGDLAHRFRCDPSAMRGMVEHWVGKGKARELPCAPLACGKSCCGCTKAPEVIYEWVEGPPH